MRKRIFEVIEVAEESDVLSKIYDITMMIVIVVSLLPIALKEKRTTEYDYNSTV